MAAYSNEYGALGWGLCKGACLPVDLTVLLCCSCG